jgi:uncharacterized protein YecT (DUF1311 family)
VRRILVATAVAFLAAASNAQAAEQDCAEAKTYMDMTACSGAKFRQADKKLNATYKALLPKLDENGRNALKEAQRAWITFRDAECKYRASPSEGGAIWPMEEASCATSMTLDRINDLSEPPP